MLKFVASTASWEVVGGIRGGLALDSLDGRGEDAGANDEKRSLFLFIMNHFKKVKARDGDCNGEKEITQPGAQAQLPRASPSVPGRLVPAVTDSCS